MRRPVAFHHVLLAMFPFLFLFAHNVGNSIGDRILGLTLAMTMSGAAAFVVGWLLGRVARDTRKGAALASIAALAFFSYGHAHNLIEGIAVGTVLVGRHRIFLIGWTIAVVIAAVAAFRARGDLAWLTRAANAGASALMTIAALQLVSFEWRRAEIPVTPLPTGAVASAALGDTLRPDIYYIILDAYAGAATLSDLYGFDNTSFLENLRTRGFYVATHSRSNYPVTVLSIASSLNMDYVHGRLHPDDAKNFIVLSRELKDNAVLRFLRSRGYRYIHFRSGNDVTDYNPRADRNIGCAGLSEFWMTFVQTTALKPFESQFGALSDDARRRILCQFDRLERIVDEPGPKFVFAHFLVPHPPFLFDAEGRAIPPPTLALTGAAAWSDRGAYLGQLVFVSRRILQTVDQIRTRSTKPPIIVIQSDHGPHSLDGTVSARARVREAMFILNAYSFPDRTAAAVLHATISPVNTFRVLFNEYFGTRFPLLPDDSFFLDGTTRYAVQNVTDHLR